MSAISRSAKLLNLGAKFANPNEYNPFQCQQYVGYFNHRGHSVRKYTYEGPAAVIDGFPSTWDTSSPEGKRKVRPDFMRSVKGEVVQKYIQIPSYGLPSHPPRFWSLMHMQGTLSKDNTIPPRLLFFLRKIGLSMKIDDTYFDSLSRVFKCATQQLISMQKIIRRGSMSIADFMERRISSIFTQVMPSNFGEMSSFVRLFGSKTSKTDLSIIPTDDDGIVKKERAQLAAQFELLAAAEIEKNRLSTDEKILYFTVALGTLAPMIRGMERLNIISLIAKGAFALSVLNQLRLRWDFRSRDFSEKMIPAPIVTTYGYKSQAIGITKKLKEIIPQWIRKSIVYFACFPVTLFAVLETFIMIPLTLITNIIERTLLLTTFSKRKAIYSMDMNERLNSSCFSIVRALSLLTHPYHYLFPIFMDETEKLARESVFRPYGITYRRFIQKLQKKTNGQSLIEFHRLHINAMSPMEEKRCFIATNDQGAFLFKRVEDWMSYYPDSAPDLQGCFKAVH